MKTTPTDDTAEQNTTPTPEPNILSDAPASDLEILQADEVEVATDVNAATTASTEEAARAAIAELTSDLQRTRADFENYRKQVESQRTQAMVSAKYSTVTKFLPLIDDFSRALETYPDQLAPLQKSFDKTLQSLGLAQINSTPGTEFNPDFHEAISVEDNDGELEVISETLRPGYLYDGAVIRAAMVKVKHQ